MSDESTDARYRGIVLQWLLTRDPAATAVTQAVARGTDWAGDSMVGFHSEFSVDISYTTNGTDSRWMSVDGDELESLWHHVMAAALHSVESVPVPE